MQKSNRRVISPVETEAVYTPRHLPPTFTPSHSHVYTHTLTITHSVTLTLTQALLPMLAHFALSHSYSHNITLTHTHSTSHLPTCLGYYHLPRPTATTLRVEETQEDAGLPGGFGYQRQEELEAGTSQAV